MGWMVGEPFIFVGYVMYVCVDVNISYSPLLLHFLCSVQLSGMLFGNKFIFLCVFS